MYRPNKYNTTMATKCEPLTSSTCIRSWFERFEFFLTAGDLAVPVPELAEDRSNLADRNTAIHKNLSLFISKLDEHMYKLLKSLVSPKDLNACTHEECKKAIVDHLCPAPTKFAQRFKLRSCTQEENEGTPLLTNVISPTTMSHCLINSWLV